MQELPSVITLVPTPHARRAFAFAFDLYVTAIVVLLAAVPVQLIWPPDTSLATTASVVFGLTVGLAYLGFAPALFGNTLGKSLFSLRLVSRDGGRVSQPSLLKRLIAAVVWPLHAPLVALRRSRSHLGDDWAKTCVVLTAPSRNFWFALTACTLLAVAAFGAASFASRVAMLRTEVWQEARETLAKEPGAKVPLLPASYSLVGNVAMFHVNTGHGMRRVILVRSVEGWIATDSQPVAGDSRQSNVIEASGRVTAR